MKILSFKKTKICPYCLDYKNKFVICDSCGEIFCLSCKIEISKERKVCAECFPAEYEELYKLREENDVKLIHHTKQ